MLIKNIFILLKMLWFFTLFAVVAVASIIISTLAIIFTYQESLCVTDPHIICHADYQCNYDPANTTQSADPSEPQYTIKSHFMKYSDSCLFGNVEAGNCVCKDQGFEDLNSQATTFTNPYKLDQSVKYYNSKTQNLCNSDVYPAGTMIPDA